jgi:hypothetical protein
MTRKTPAVAIQVVPPLLESIAFHKGRLIDFDTGSDKLEAQHQKWLTTQMAHAKQQSMYRIRLVGYASKLGGGDANWALSVRRIDSVRSYLEKLDPAAPGRIETFRANGEDAYQAAESDNDATWRAVEVHIFIGDLPPPPPKITPIPPKVHALPGPRFTDWEIAAPGGVTVGPGIVGGFNVYVIKDPTGNMHGFLQPQVGAGASLSIPGLGAIKFAIQTLLTAGNYSNMSFTAVKSSVPISWEEIGSSLVRVTGGVAGVAVLGYGYSIITFMATSLWQIGPSGFPLRVADNRVLFQFTSSGKNSNLGGSLAVTLGTLFRID